MIEFHLEARSGVPTYLQLVQQVSQAIRLGILRPGDQLPTVKEVVSSLTINPNTVLQAYRELDLEGLIEGRRGVGHVRRGAPPRRCRRTTSRRCAPRCGAGSRRLAPPGSTTRTCTRCLPTWCGRRAVSRVA